MTVEKRKARKGEGEQLHPIRVVARRTGLTPEVLRSWEKRYEAVVPLRKNGRRYYTADDLDRLLLLRKATIGGRSIGQVAGLETEELRQLVVADDEAARRAPARGAAAGASSTYAEPLQAAEHLEHCLDSVRNMDPEGLEGALERATLDLSRIDTVEHVVAPLMQKVGDLWSEGTLRIAHEHVTSAVVRTFLGSLGSARWSQETSARLVAATPAGQIHELGALVAGASAAAEGWGVTYLGPDLPAEEIAAAARSHRAGVVALSLVHPADDPRLAGELRKLLRLLPGKTTIVLGGSAAAGYAEAIGSPNVRLAADLPAFRTFLEEARNGSGSKGASTARESRRSS